MMRPAAERKGESIMGQWMETNRAVVFPAHCDHIGHMNVRWYAHAFDTASFHAWARIGVTFEAMHREGAVTVVARTATDYLREVRAGTLIVVESAFTRLGTKSATYRQRLTDAEAGTLHAVQEVVEVFFDPETRRSTAMPSNFREKIAAALLEED